MPKLKLPARCLFEKIKAHGESLAQQSTELFTCKNASNDKQTDEQKPSPNSSPLHARDIDVQSNTLQRVTALPRSHSFSPWIGAEFFICISVKEGIDLSPSVPMPSATCDSFVRVTLGRPGALPLEEAETRVITRNCYPMWEECLPFPLDHVTEDTIITMRVLDKDIGHFNSFLGTVSLSLKDALAAIRKVEHEKIYRLPLLDRQNNARKRGELLFGVAVVAKQEYKEMRGFISSLQDPDTVHDSLRDYCLHLKLHCLKELSGISTGMLAALVMEISVCSYVVRKPLSGQLVGGELDPEGAEVVVPLGPAFQDGDTLKGKARAQFGEVKVELFAGRTRLAKTQVPIWDVPVRSEGAATPAAGEGSPPDSDSEGEVEREEPGRRRPLMSTYTCLSDTPANAAPQQLPARSSAVKAGAAAGARAVSPEPGIRGATAGLQRTAELAAAAAAAPNRCSENGASPTRVAGGKDDAASCKPGGGSGVTRAPWDGKRYSRRMERLDRCLNRCPVAALSMQLVKAEPGDSYDASVDGASDRSLGTISAAAAAGSSFVFAPGERGGDDVFGGSDVDSPPEALSVPAFPNSQVVADYVVVGLGPTALLRTMYADGAELMGRVWNLEKVTGIKIDPWGPDPEGKALGSRNLAYMKPSPVGMVAVTSQQKIMIKHAGGFVVHQYVTPVVPPVGQCVRVFAQIVGQHAGPNRTRFTASIKLEWFKSGMMINALKGKVEAATPKDTRKFFDSLRQELAVKHAVEGPGAAAEGAGAGTGGSAATAAATAADGGSAVASTGPAVAEAGAGDGLGALPSGSVAIVVAVLVGGLVFALLLMAWSLMRVRGELGRSLRALEGVSAELRAVSSALQALVAALPAVAAGAGAPAAARP